MADIHFKTAGDLLKAIASGQADERTQPDYSDPKRDGRPSHVLRRLPSTKTVPEMFSPLTGEVLPASQRVDYVVYHPMPGWYTLPIEEVVLLLVLVNVVIWLSI